MVKVRPRVVIDNVAKAQLKLAYAYVKQDSPKSAEKVKAKILSRIKELADHPEKYPKDKYRLDKDASYRAFEVYKYRISYHASQEQITVIMIRHTKMEPKSH